MAKEWFSSRGVVPGSAARCALHGLKLENGMDVAAYASGKMRKFHPHSERGSRDARDVAYDLSKARICFRHKDEARSPDPFARNWQSTGCGCPKPGCGRVFLSGAVLTASMVRRERAGIGLTSCRAPSQRLTVAVAVASTAARTPASTGGRIRCSRKLARTHSFVRGPDPRFAIGPPGRPAWLLPALVAVGAYLASPIDLPDFLPVGPGR